jgi:hypothetical protein
MTLLFTKITSIPSLLKKKAEKTGVDVFDRVWDDFHGSMHDPGNERREFGDVLKKHPSKHQVLVALGKMNYTVDNGGFARWIKDDYAFNTGDLLLKKLPHDDHAFPILSKVHDLVKAVLDAYGEFGVDSFKDLEHLLIYMKGPDSGTLWKWFKKAKGHLFQSQKYIQSPHDLDYVTGKWGVIHFHEKPLNEGLVEKIENELSTEENQARKDDLSTVLAVIDDRLALQEEWERFKDGEWTNAAEVALDTLDDRYHETVSIATLAAEAAEWFDATPDEVEVVAESDVALPKTS